MMDASVFIARRIRFKGGIATIAVAISFLVMIIAVAVSGGFRKEIREGVSNMSGDVMLVPPGMNVLEKSAPVEADAAYLQYVKEIDGVCEIRPAVYSAGLLKMEDELFGAVFKGTDAVGEFPDSVSLPVSVPVDLARKAGIEVGDRILTYFISDKVKVRQFNVVSMYEHLVGTGDPVIRARISDLQRLEGWAGNEVSCMEVILDADRKEPESMRRVADEAGVLIRAYSEDDEASVIAVSSASRFRVIFDWLDVIDFNVFFILVLMTIVAGFNMISGLLILLFENISKIGLLKSVGMTDRAISKVFLYSSASLVFKGMLWGNALAFIVCMIQGTTHLLKLDPENYFVSYVPVSLDLGYVLLADLIAFSAIMLLLLIPCLFISKVDPADTVRVK